MIDHENLAQIRGESRPYDEEGHNFMVALGENVSLEAAWAFSCIMDDVEGYYDDKIRSYQDSIEALLGQIDELGETVDNLYGRVEAQEIQIQELQEACVDALLAD